MAVRQQVLILYLAHSALDAPVVAWSCWDGSGTREHMAGDADEPPYATGLAALRDGWRLFQVSPLLPHASGDEFRLGYLKYEYLFEKLVDGEHRVEP
ncbi:MAG: hypothetical protein V2I63_11270 [Pseudomonadales bacterium]|nr:hypothetical protein [Pseudomonadales bacterium]